MPESYKSVTCHVYLQIMNSRSNSLGMEIKHNMPYLCKAVQPEQLFLAVSVHLHTIDEVRDSQIPSKLNSPL